MFIYCFSILFGAFSSLALGKFIGISFAEIHMWLVIALIGAAIGGITGSKIVRRDNSRKNIRGLITACFSLWFGITTGLIAGVVLAQITIFPLFTYKFGNPETSPWPATAANIFLILIVAMAIAGGLGIGVWFFHNTLKSRFKAEEPDQINGENDVKAPAVSPEQDMSTTSDDRLDQ